MASQITYLERVLVDNSGGCKLRMGEKPASKLVRRRIDYQLRVEQNIQLANLMN